jgi:REP element-mobilizing transposase RayT
MPRFRKGSHKHEEYFGTQHRFEHWYRDNTVYFITSRCRGKFNAFLSEETKSIFWRQFDRFTEQYSFTPIVTSLLSNHYHVLGYLKKGENLPKMMRLLHGSIAKLVNDTLTERLRPFWVDTGHQNYFDGCVRDELQCRRAFRYTLTQCQRHHVCSDPARYPHTRVRVEIDRAVKRAHELQAFLEEIPYKRYQK